MLALQSAFGFIAILLIAWLASEDRRAVPWRIVVTGALLQIVLAAALLKLPLFQDVFLALNELLSALERATQEGTRFVFGFLGGGPQPFAEQPGASSFVLAFRALPLILVVSALSALLFYWRVLPAVVRAFAVVLEKAMGVGGAVGLSTAANIFVGMVEAPLVVRPYLKEMSRGELFIVMTAGMAGIAGTVMALYAAILGPVVPDAMGHILSASIISAPAAILVAAVMVPPRGAPTSGRLVPPQQARSSMDAVTRGTLDGLQLLLAAWAHHAFEGRYYGPFLMKDLFGVTAAEAAAGIRPVVSREYQHNGWDGQFYYRASTDLFGRGPDIVPHMEMVTYRYQRIGVPAAAAEESEVSA